MIAKSTYIPKESPEQEEFARKAIKIAGGGEIENTIKTAQFDLCFHSIVEMHNLLKKQDNEIETFKKTNILLKTKIIELKDKNVKLLSAYAENNKKQVEFDVKPVEQPQKPVEKQEKAVEPEQPAQKEKTSVWQQLNTVFARNKDVLFYLIILMFVVFLVVSMVTRPTPITDVEPTEQVDSTKNNKDYEKMQSEMELTLLRLKNKFPN